MHEQSTRLLGSLHVTDLARRAGVTPATVRYYARSNLIKARRDPTNGYRCFSETDAQRIEFIRQAQAFGLTIRDIKRILDLVAQGKDSSNLVKSLVVRSLGRVRRRIASLQTTEMRISRDFAAWKTMVDLTAADGELCLLVERLDRYN